jgi:hypothetical protein
VLLDRTDLIAEFVDLLRDPLEILVFFVEPVETSIDFPKRKRPLTTAAVVDCGGSREG